MSALVLGEVRKTFGATAAVAGVSLEVADAELLVLLGPSGCGKSTLLRLVAGLQTLDAGAIAVGGVPVDGPGGAVPPERRRVGLVFQEHALFPHLTVAQNVAFGVRRRRDAERTVDRMLGLVGLSAHRDRYPHELSGGERQRVALVRALAPEPALLLLDEPFASLDQNLRSRVRTEVVEVLRETGTPAVFVTHDQHEALSTGDRVAVMHEGTLRQVGTPAEVYHQPVSRFVAGFVGEADFLAAATAARHLGDLPAAPPEPAGRVLVVRPDDVTVEPDAAGVATVVRAEYRGSTWVYTAQLPTGERLRAMTPHTVTLAPGTPVTCRLRPGHRPVWVPDSGTP